MKVVLLTALDIRGNSMFQKFKIAFYAIIVWLVLVSCLWFVGGGGGRLGLSSCVPVAGGGLAVS